MLYAEEDAQIYATGEVFKLCGEESCPFPQS